MKVALVILALVSLASASSRSNHLLTKSINSGRIVGGEEAGENEFTWQISLQTLDEAGQRIHWCGGTIYSELHVVTAAQCLTNQNVADLRVVAGDHDLFDITGNEQARNVASYVLNPDFDASTYNNDVAVITLTEPLIFNMRVQPIRIAESSLEPSGKCVTTGWGNTMGDGSVNNPAKLQKVELEIVPRDECTELYSGLNVVTDGMVCAAVPGGGKGACSGDSGGPLVCKDESSREYLAGIVSWGVVPCAQDGYPSVYSNVAAYRSFVQSVVNPNRK